MSHYQQIWKHAASNCLVFNVKESLVKLIKPCPVVVTQITLNSVLFNLMLLIDNSIMCFYSYLYFFFLCVRLWFFDHCLFTEVSGQNFVHEDHRGKLSREFIPKRFKRASADASSNDQVMSTISTKKTICLPPLSHIIQIMWLFLSLNCWGTHFC